MSEPQQDARAEIPTVSYIRMSTAQQHDSPERQRADIHRYLKQHPHEKLVVVRELEDDAKSGMESLSRPAFQQLLADARDGKVKAVIFSEQSRLSREDPLDAFIHFVALHRAGARIINCKRGDVDMGSFAGQILVLADAHQAHNEAKDILSRSVSGKRAKLERSERYTSPRVFGYDRVLVDDSGNVVQRVHFSSKFSKPKNWRTRIEPSEDMDAVNAVRWMFEAFRQGSSCNDIAIELNRRGLKTIHGHRFSFHGIPKMLRNPVYMGTYRVGIRPCGKFEAVTREPTLMENAHPAIISAELFYAVQQLLAIRAAKPEKSPTRRHVLSGIVNCASCGSPLYGRSHGSKAASYYCSCRVQERATREAPICAGLSVHADWLEQSVFNLLRDKVMSPATKQNLLSAIAAYGDVGEMQDMSAESRRLVSLSDMIERAENNLALVDDPDDFAAIKKRLGKLRTEREQVRERLDDSRSKTVLAPEAAAALANLSALVDMLGNSGDRRPSCSQLRVCYVVVIRQISVGRSRVRAAPRVKFKRGTPKNLLADTLTLKVEFTPGVFDTDSVELDLVGPTTSENVRDFAAYVHSQAPRPVTNAEIHQRFKLKHPSTTVRAMQRAELLGLVVWRGTARTGGWVTAGETRQEPADKRIREVIRFVRMLGRVQRKDVCRQFGCSNTSAHWRLTEAAKLGFVSRPITEGRQRYWCAIEVEQ